MSNYHIIPVGKGEPIHLADSTCHCQPIKEVIRHECIIVHKAIHSKIPLKRKGTCVTGRGWVGVLGEDNHEPDEFMSKDECKKLVDADPKCRHVHTQNCMSGIRCKKCGGWYCL